MTDFWARMPLWGQLTVGIGGILLVVLVIRAVWQARHPSRIDRG